MINERADKWKVKIIKSRKLVENIDLTDASMYIYIYHIDNTCINVYKSRVRFYWICKIGVFPISKTLHISQAR